MPTRRQSTNPTIVASALAEVQAEIAALAAIEKQQEKEISELKEIVRKDNALIWLMARNLSEIKAGGLVRGNNPEAVAIAEALDNCAPEYIGCFVQVFEDKVVISKMPGQPGRILRTTKDKINARLAQGVHH